jgi:hypothetical protein
MRTIHKIFTYIFLAMGIFCAGAVCCGATHQWIIALMCFIVYGVMWAEDREEPEHCKK